VFMPNPLVVIAPADHPLAGQRAIDPRRLREERFILREKGSGTRMAVDAHWRRLRAAPPVRLELGSNEAVKEAVAGHLGLSVVSVHALGERWADQGLCVLDVQGFPIRSQWHVVRLRQKRPSPIARVFEQHLAAQARDWSPPAGLGDDTG